MKSATPELEALLRSREFASANIFTIDRGHRGVIRVTDYDVPVLWRDEIFSCYGLQASGLSYRVVTGLEADEQSLLLGADPSTATMIDGQPFIVAVQNGALDRATIKRERAYFGAESEPSESGVMVPVGCFPLFTGYVSTISEITQTTAELKVKSDIALLDVSKPSNTWQAPCGHTLYDKGCGVDKSAFGLAGTAESGSTDIVVNWSGAESAYFWKGVINFTSGANAGQRRTIKNSTGTQFLLANPMPFAVSEGDAFIAYPGCDHTMTTCKNRFANFSHFRGCPFIPTAETAL